MKKNGRLKQLMALMLAGALTAGSVGTPVFGSDFGDTAIEVSAEEEAVAEEAIEEVDNAAVEESGDGTVSDDADVPEDNFDSNVEAYTVTLDANGGYFVNEWDDVRNCSADNVEILSKNIPVGGAVSSFPVREQEGSNISFLGWSLERDGELLTQENQEYIPVENCVLYAVWKNMENADDSYDANEESVGSYTDTEDDFNKNDNYGFNTIEDTDYDTVGIEIDTADSEERQDDTSQTADYSADQMAGQSEVDQTEAFPADTPSEEVESIFSEEASDQDSFSHDTEETLDDTGSENEKDAAQNQDHAIFEDDEQKETTRENASGNVVANGALGDNLTWTLGGDGVLTISGNGDMCDAFEVPWDKDAVKIVIIESGVTSIGASAFEYCENLSSVTIPDSVKLIDSDAFYSCTSLESVVIPDSVITLGHSAFAYCENLSSVTMPATLLRFSADAFAGTPWLDGLAATDGFTIVNGVLIRYIGDSSEVTIPDGVTIIGDSAFLRNENLTEVVIPSTVTEVGSNAFYECSNLADIMIPDEVTSIGEDAFRSCISLTNVKLPVNLQVIERNTFYDCSSLKNISIPDSVTEIKSSAFYGCMSLDIEVLPENLIEIGADAFSHTGLTTVTISDNVKIIRQSAFLNCQELTSVTISDVDTVIEGVSGGGAFYSCDNLTDVTMPDGLYRCSASAFMSTPWLSTVLENTKDENGFSIIHGILIGYSGAASEVTIPDGVTIIGSESLRDRCLTSVTIPESVNEIDIMAFSNNDELMNIRIPASVKKIGDMAFDGCACDDYEYNNSDFTIYGYVGSEAERYANEVGHTFIAIEKSSLVNATVTVEDQTFTGNELKPVPDVKLNDTTLRADVDYTVSYSNNTNAGTATITITGIGKYQDIVTKNFTIKMASPILSFSSPSVSKTIMDSAFTNAFTKTTDGTVTFSSSNTSVATVNSSTGLVTIRGTGNTTITANAAEGRNYNAGAASYSLTVSTLSLSDCIMTISPGSYTYDGTEKEPTVTIKYNSTNLTINGDYTVSYSNNTNAGKGTVTATGKGGYSGTLSKTFTIDKAIQSITASNLSLTYPNSGKITASGNKGSLSYKSSNTAIATVDSAGKVTAKGAGKATITITAAATSNYNAATKTITVTVGKAAQSITAKAAASSIAVGKTTTVSITGAKGTKSFKSSDTTVAAVNASTGLVTAKKVGTVKITATSAATAQYNAASKTVTIKVVPAATASLTAANQATGIKLTWKKVTGANGYKVYRGSTLIKTITSGSTVTYADAKANTNGTKYTYKVVAKASTGDSTLSKSVSVYRVARPAVPSVTNSASKKMTVKWGKNAKANGYQIQYSTDKTFKSGNKAVTATGASTVSKVIGSLTKGKTYYVRIRTYKTVGSAKYWSEWSAARSVKISK